MQKYGMLEEYDKIILQSKFILKECDLCDNCLEDFSLILPICHQEKDWVIKLEIQ